MKTLLAVTMVSSCLCATLAAQNLPIGASPGAQTGSRDAQAALRTARNAASAQPTPRLPDGTVNLGRVGGEKGVWGLPGILNFAQMAVGGPENGDPRLAGVATGGAAKEPWIPFMAWSAAVYNYHSMNESKYDPEGYCLPPGGPRLMGTPYPAEIFQFPEQKRIFIVFEGGAHIWREIYMDGRPHPAPSDLKGLTWLGHSVGRWEGDTLVIDTAGFNEGTWIDRAGHPHTDQLHIIERITRPNKGLLHFEATIDDPGAYTKPWTTRWDIPWRAGQELQEYICQENNQYQRTLHDDFGRPIFYDPPRGK
ncbi:MAG: hypothetical protein HYU27_07945 [Acidobacteria bacterium]|nr:hypothetical protein [Acidobacteriota bacterium]